MIEVQDLTKSYGERTAVDHVSFAVNKGEILGFWSQWRGQDYHDANAHGFHPATCGTASIAGFDVFDNSLEVRRQSDISRRIRRFIRI